MGIEIRDSLVTKQKRILEYAVGLNSIIGTRKNQQDFAGYTSDGSGLLAVVCDGMGGLEGGERASCISGQMLIQAYKKRNKEVPIPQFFEQQVLRMDAAVCEIKGKLGKSIHAGTTIVAVVVQSNRLYYMSVGDSKIYIIRQGKVQQITKEHNYLAELNEQLAAGKITKEKYSYEVMNKRTDALTSFIGIGNLRLTDIANSPVELQEGDMVLLCSDGLYKSLSDDQIMALAQDNDIDMRIAAERLTAMALAKAKGGQDNTSVVLLKYQPNL